MENLNSLLSRYQGFLFDSWKTVETAFTGEEGETQKDNWLQANWELLVEEYLSDKSIDLLPYGYGADTNGASSRITFPDLIPTHSITILQDQEREYDLLNDQIIDYTLGELIFERFVATRDDGWYYEEPPFDKILCTKNDKEMIVPLKDVKFALTSKLK